MEWFVIEEAGWEKFPRWMRSFGISKNTGDIYVAGAIAGDEREIVLSAMGANIPAARRDDHVFVPAGWLSSTYPDAKRVCDVLVTLAALRKPAAAQASVQDISCEPWKTLSLRHSITPGNAVTFALEAAEQVQINFGLRLDFSPSSLALADELIDRTQVNPPSEGIAEFLFGIGCYLGQVMVKHAGCSWVKSQGTELESHTDFPIVLRLCDGTHAQPISKAFKRFNNGAEDSLADFYGVFHRGAFLLGKI